MSVFRNGSRGASHLLIVCQVTQPLKFKNEILGMMQLIKSPVGKKYPVDGGKIGNYLLLFSSMGLCRNDATVGNKESIMTINIWNAAVSRYPKDYRMPVSVSNGRFLQIFMKMQ